MKNRLLLFLVVTIVIFLFLIGSNFFRSPIKKGCVIAYGRYIEPPYSVEVKDTKLLINEVQILPRPETKSSAEKAAEEEIKKVEDDYKQKYWDWKEQYSEKKAREKLGEYISQNKKISGYKFGVSNNVNKIKYVVLKFKDGIEEEIYYSAPPNSQLKIAHRHNDELMRQYIEFVDKYGWKSAWLKITDVLKKDKFIKKITHNVFNEVTGHVTIFMRFKNGAHGQIVSSDIKDFKNSGATYIEPKQKTKAEEENERYRYTKLLEYEAEEIKNNLREDSSVYYANHYGGGGSKGTGTRMGYAIEDILKSKKSNVEKKKSLKGLFSDTYKDISEEMAKYYNIQ